MVKITAYFTDKGVPKTGLSPTIDGWEVGGSQEITAQGMTEDGLGFYYYEYAGYDNSKYYSFRCDGGATLSGYDRYTIGGSSDLPAVLEDTDTMEADLKTHIDTAETNLTAEIDANEAKIDIIDTNVDTIQTKTDNLPADTEAELNRILGLLFQNAAWEFTFTGQDQTSGGIWLYDTAGNLATHDKSTGKIGEYSMTCTFTLNKPDVMKISKVS